MLELYQCVCAMEAGKAMTAASRSAKQVVKKLEDTVTYLESANVMKTGQEKTAMYFCVPQSVVMWEAGVHHLEGVNVGLDIRDKTVK